MDRGLGIVTGLMAALAGVMIGKGFVESQIFLSLIGGSIGLTGLVPRYSGGSE